MSNSLTGSVHSLYSKLPAGLKDNLRPLVYQLRPLFSKWKRASSLSLAQKAEWEKRGFLVLEKFYSDEEVDRINNFIDELWATRKDNPDSPLALDCFLNTENSQRLMLTHAPDEARDTLYKLYDLYLEYEHIRQFVCSPRMHDILWALLGEEPIICNTINFERGSGQELHFDTWYMAPPKEAQLIATWAALEDISPEAGALRYVPGSHKIKPYIFNKSGCTVASYEELPQAVDYVNEEIERLGLQEETFIANKGDVLIWHAQLLHGGSPVKDPSLTRRSLVTHFWRRCDIPENSQRFDNSQLCYLHRPHQVPQYMEKQISGGNAS